MLKKSLKWLALALAAGLLISACLAYWLARTESGLKFVLGQAAPQLTVRSASGALDKFVLQGVHLDTDQVSVKIAELQGRWRIRDLYSRLLNISKLTASEMTVTIKPSQNTSTESLPNPVWSGVFLPLHVRVDEASAHQVKILSAEQTIAGFTRLKLQAVIRDNVLALQELELQALRFAAISDQVLNANIQGRVDLSARANGQVELQNVIEGYALNTAGKAPETAFSLRGSLQGRWRELELQQSLVFGGESAQQARLNVSGRIDKPLYAERLLSIDGQWRAPFSIVNTAPAPTPDKRLIAGYSIQELTSRGEFTLSGAPQNYQLAVNGHTLHQQTALLELGLQARGDTEHIELDHFKVSILEQDTQEALQSKASRRPGQNPSQNSGDLQGSAKLSWSAGLHLESELLFSGFDPRLLFPSAGDLPSNIRGSVFAEARQQRDAGNGFGWIGHLRTDSLQADWQAQTLRLNAELDLSQQALEVRKLNASYGGTRLNATGAVNDRLNFRWDLTAPDLSILPNLAGTLSATGQLSGARQNPALTATVNADGLRYSAGSEAGSAVLVLDQLTARVQSSGLSQDSTVQVQAQANSLLRDKQLLVKELLLSLNGKVGEHQLNLSLVAPDYGDLRLAISGELHAPNNPAPVAEPTMAAADSEATQWLGRLTAMTVAPKHQTVWQLNEPAVLSVSAASVQLQKTCLYAEEQTLCADYARHVNQGAADQGVGATVEQHALAQLENFSIAQLNPWLASWELQAMGKADGQIELIQSPEHSAVQIHANLNGENWQLELPDTVAMAVQPTADDGVQTTPSRVLPIASVDVQFEQQETMKLRANLVVDDNRFAQADIATDRALGEQPFAETKLSGLANIVWADLRTVPIPPSIGVELAGRLDSELKLGGTFHKPDIDLHTEISDGALAIQSVGLELKALNLSANSTAPNRVAIKGSAYSGAGQLELAGDLNFIDFEKPEASLSIVGENLDLLQTSDMDVKGGVDLKLALADRVTDVRGKIAIAEANITIGASENVILESDDVVLAGEQEAIQAARQRLKIVVDLGSNTRLVAAGLNAKLGGKLEVNQRPGELITGRGQITISDGVYRAYGEQFLVSDGRLIFDGSSIDNPSLDVQASKEVDDVTAGVRVSGRAQSPHLDLYSNPSMSDQDILAVLVFGKPVSSLTSEDSLTLLKIAASLRGDGPDRFTQMTNRLQESLGLTELELRLDGEDTELVAGKQLSSKFYVGYGYGLLDAAQSLVLRYKINDLWSIQGDFGANSGADLRYQLER